MKTKDPPKRRLGRRIVTRRPPPMPQSHGGGSSPPRQPPPAPPSDDGDDNDYSGLHALMAQIEKDAILGWFDISLMKLEAYASPVSEAKVNRMLRVFNPLALATITLALLPDGMYAILDGHHRVQACRKVGITRMCARVLKDQDYKQRARLFRELNTVDRKTALDKFRTRLEEEEPTALDIKDILAEYEMRVGIHGPQVGTIQAVGALDKTYEELGPTGLDYVVSILYRAWGRERKAWITVMIDGMRQFWARYWDDVDLDRLVSQLQLFTPEQLMAQAGLASIKTASPGTILGRKIVDHYNHGLRRHKLSDWVDHPGKRFLDHTGPPVDADDADDDDDDREDEDDLEEESQ